MSSCLSPHEPSPGSKTILVVDDEWAIVETLCEVLEDEGFRCLGAGDGLEALQLAERECPDLVITDVMMPIMDGHELVQALREREPLRLTPVIMVSAARAMLQAYDPRRVCTLEKPFTIDAVLGLVSTLVGGATVLRS